MPRRALRAAPPGRPPAARGRGWATSSRSRTPCSARAPRRTISPTWATPRWATEPTSAPASSPATTTARASTRPRSAPAPSSAATPCWWRRSRSGEGATTAAGSIITKNVPAGALAVGRVRQKNLEGWAGGLRRRRGRPRQERERIETYVRNRRIRWPARGRAPADGRPAPPGVPRLRLGGRGGGARRRVPDRQGRGQARPPEGEAREAAAHRPLRPRPHPLGHPRAAERAQRPPDGRLARPAGADPQRHHRELPAAQEAADRRGVDLHLRHRHRGRRQPHLLLPRRRPARRGRPRGQGAGGDVRLRRGQRRDRRAGDRRRPPGAAAGRRPRRGRAVPRLRSGRPARLHQGRDLPRERRHRPPHPRRHRDPGPRGQARRAPRPAPQLGPHPGREGGLQALHAQGDPRAAAGRAGDLRRARGLRERRDPPRHHPDHQGGDRADRAPPPAGLRHLLARGAGRQVPDREDRARAGRGRLRLRVPLPRPDRLRPRARRRHLPVRRDGGHPLGHGGGPRARRAPVRDLQRRGEPGDPHQRGGDLHPRRPGDRRRLDQGLHHPARRPLPARPLPAAEPARARSSGTTSTPSPACRRRSTR